MSKTAEPPADVVELAKTSDVVLAAELGDYLARARRMFHALWEHCMALEARIAASTLDTKDEELALHHLWLREVGDLSEEMRKRLGQVEEHNELRIALVVNARGSDGFLKFGKKFTACGDLLPSPPAQKSDEYPAYIEYMRANHPDKLHDSVPTVPFGSLRAICNELAAQGALLPPGVKLSTKLSVKVSG